MRIGGFIPVSLSDFPGRVSAIVFTQGCNFRCPFCHNPSLVLPEEFSEPIYEESILNYLESQRRNLDGVVISGGEPTIHSDLIDFIKKLKNMGFQVKLDTNGSNPEVVEKLINEGLLDYCAMDIKAPWEKYKFLTGLEKVDVKPIQKTLEVLLQSGIEIEFRTTFATPLLEWEDIDKIKQYIPSKINLNVQKFISKNVLNKTLFAGR
ncbi:MAG: anaerobic ribonucleoside-triphosphate reductase activating protein [Candidatus Hydrogenedentes bacterium]|nr:anaerobic ribonucleoside-triphosphate reductase activating protein [Candidatus Hydrogenedentota bacterium]